jgi:hypothetical protein
MRSHPEAALFDRLDALPTAERERLLHHAAGCESSRAGLAAGDSSRLFALLAADPLPAERLAEFSAKLDLELDRTTPQRTAPRWIGAAAALAASTVLAGFLGSYVLWQSRISPQPVSGAPPASAPLAVAVTEQEIPAGGVELISTPGDAQVMELAIGETKVVMIFDEALDI